MTIYDRGKLKIVPHDFAASMETMHVRHQDEHDFSAGLESFGQVNPTQPHVAN